MRPADWCQPKGCIGAAPGTTEPMGERGQCLYTLKNTSKSRRSAQNTKKSISNSNNEPNFTLHEISGLTRLSDLGLDENTIVVFTSDHGDFLGDHGMLFKGPFCCRSLLNIPLIIAEPNGPKDRVDSISSNIDVAPELLYRCGISIPEEFQGLPLTRSGNNQFREYALSAAWYCRGSEYFNYSICTNEWRLTVYPVLTQGELYNLSDDPFENQNQYNNPTCNGPKEELLRCLQIEHGRASGTVQLW